jgi:hypothetical protein
MAICTYINSHENQNVEDERVLKTLAELNRLDRNAWIIQGRKFTRFLRKPVMRYELLNRLDGVEYQVINFCMPWEWSINTFVPLEVIHAYLIGLIAGLTKK